MLGTLLFIPLALAFVAGYGYGDGLFWLVLFGEFILIWWFIYLMLVSRKR